MNETVSIILPAYNAEKYLKRCLKSIAEQTYQHYEVIIIDDGSADSTGSIADSAANDDSRIKVIHQKNSGVSAARNAGLQKAEGKYIACVDADDVIEPKYLEKLVGSIEKSGAQLSVCSYYHTDVKLNILRKSSLEDQVVTGADIVEKMLRFRNINSAIWNKLFMLDIIRDNGIAFNSRYAIGEDMLFLANYCTHVDKAVILSDHLYRYVSNPEGAMLSKKSGKFDTKWLTEWKAVKETERVLSEGGIRSDMIKVKKLRIADKLLSMTAKTGYNDPELKKELAKYLRKNVRLILTTSDFSAKKKCTCMLNVIYPGWHRFVK